METRLDKWRKPRTVPFLTGGEKDDELWKLLSRRQKQYIEKNANEDKRAPKEPSAGDFLESAKELIFDISGNDCTFYIVAPTLNLETGQMELGYTLDLHIEGEPLADGIRTILALAHHYDVPVVPNSRECVHHLEAHYKGMIVEGFEVNVEGRSKYRMHWPDSQSRKSAPFDYIQSFELLKPRQPGELLLLRDTIVDEFAKLIAANRALHVLRAAIYKLSEILAATERNEGALQQCLKENPALFGPDYLAIIPQHKLGSEYQMDYALQRVGGLVDLVEIEASTHMLYTKHGNPTAALVHAEQQVLDWLYWIDRHSDYARANLPQVLRPIGYVVIGRAVTLSEADRERLRQRNVVFRGALEVLTYDDLLDRAKNLLRLLQGEEDHL